MEIDSFLIPEIMESLRYTYAGVIRLLFLFGQLVYIFVIFV